MQFFSISNYLPHAALLTLALCAAGAVTAASLTVNVVDKNGVPMSDVVVSATPLHGSLPAAVKTAPAVISQSDMQFAPYVTALRVGTQVTFPNYDKMEHHVKSISPAKEFEIKTYERGVTPPPILFDRPGLVVVYCLLHNWMRAYVLVLETPYFSKSDESGAVTLDHLPDAQYKIEAWHPNMGSIKPPLSQVITLGSNNTPLRMAFDFVPTVRRSAKKMPM